MNTYIFACTNGSNEFIGPLVAGKWGEKGRRMKLRIGWIIAKIVVLLVLSYALVAFEKLVHPVMSAAVAVGQLADTVDSSAQMTAYGWVIPAGWFVIAIVFVLFVYTEVRATIALNEIKEGVR